MFIFEKTTWKWSLIWMKFRLMNNSSMILPSTKNEAASNLLTCCFSIISIFFFVCLFLWNCFECGYEFLQDCRVNNWEQNAKNRKILSAIVSKRQASKCQEVIFFRTPLTYIYTHLLASHTHCVHVDYRWCLKY